MAARADPQHPPPRRPRRRQPRPQGRVRLHDRRPGRRPRAHPRDRRRAGRGRALGVRRGDRRGVRCPRPHARPHRLLVRRRQRAVLRRHAVPDGLRPAVRRHAGADVGVAVQAARVARRRAGPLRPTSTRRPTPASRATPTPTTKRSPRARPRSTPRARAASRPCPRASGSRRRPILSCAPTTPRSRAPPASPAPIRSRCSRICAAARTFSAPEKETPR